MPLHRKPAPAKRGKGGGPKKPYFALPVAPPGITREYRVTCRKYQTYIPCNDDDIIQDGVHTYFREFVGKTLQEFVDWIYVECLDEELNTPEITVDKITR